MKIYEVIIANYLDDTNYSVLVASAEPLDKNNININAIVGIIDEYTFISDVKIPKLIGNVWNMDEYEEIEEIRNKYFN
jgi:hypothetical protein